MREISTVAAYRDRWHVTGEHIIGNQTGLSNEQTGHYQRARAAAARAVAISHDVHGEQASPTWEPQIQAARGVEL